jgi:hypothetical protein
MGCDYYIVKSLIISYNCNNEIKEVDIEFDKSREYLSGYEYDSDDESYSQYLDRVCQQISSNRTIYENGNWQIKNKEKVVEYEDIIKEQNINLSQIIKLIKKIYAYPR